MCASSSENPSDASLPRRRQPFTGAYALAVVFSVASALSAYAADAPRAADAAHPAGYVLGPGDRVRVTVFGHEDLSGEFAISETGTVSLPLAGILPFGGVKLADAERAVVRALKPDYLLNPRVSIEVLEYRPFYILGEVNSPGSYAYVNGMTVTEAVALGGGFTYRAKKGRVVVIRAGDPTRTERTIGVTDAILPGDVVKVLERIF